MVFIGFSEANAQLLQWNTFGNAGTELTEPSIFNDPNISSTNLTQGTITAAVNTNRFGGSGWFDVGNTVAGNTLAEAITGNDYIQFIVTPNSGFSFTPTSFVFQWDRSTSGPKNVTLRSSVDGFTTDLGSLVPAAALGFSNTITISGLNNIASATTFRLYGYGATATTGTGGFDLTSNVINVQLNGTTASAGSPAINVTPASLSGFTSLLGVPTTEQSYSVGGSLLTSDITITPPAGFQITKTSGSGYITNPGTIVLTQASGTVPATTIYVRMNSAIVGVNTGNITHTSASANNPSVALNGHVITTEPTIQSAITIPAPTITTFGMLVNFSGGDGAKRILVAHLGSAVNSNPVDGVTYTASTNFGSGTQIGTGNYVVYAGTGNSVTVTGLTPSTTYHFAVYDYNDVGTPGAENYLTTSPGIANATTLTSDGDFRSIATGNWSALATWQVRVADNWVAAASIPTASSNVYIQAGHTVTVDIASVSCNDLHLNITGVLAIAGNIVELSGKLRAYTGTTTITAGADGTFYSGQINTTSVGNSITTTTGVGKLKVIGNTRSITYTGEWGNNPANWDVEFAPTAGQTFTIQTGFKAGNITVASGTVLSTSTDLRPDGGALNTGSLTVKSGASLQFSNAAITIQRVSAAGVGAHFGSLTVEAGGTLEFSGTSSPIIAAGAIAFNGAVIYSGAGNQNLAIKGAANTAAVDPNTYTDLTISGGGNKTLPIPVTVNGVLNLTNGFVISTATNLLSMSSTASVTGASNTSFVSGPVAKTGATGFVFPVGKTGTGYVAVEIASLSGSETFTAEYMRGDALSLGTISANGLLNVSRCEYWILNRAGSATANVTLYWTSVNNCSAAPYITNLANLTIAHFDGVGSTWDAFAPAAYTTGTTAAGTVTWSGVSIFSKFTLGSVSFINPLAISLNYLRGVKQGNAHLLNWKVTCSSTPNVTLTLERSADGVSFKPIYSITADALRCAQPFEYNDAQPVAGTNYYRLKMTDANGKISYSNIITLINASQGFDIMHIAPNPVTGNNFTLNISSAKATQMNIVISDLQGRVVKQASLSLIAGYNTSEINIQSLAPGTYQLYGSNGTDKSKLIRFVKQ